MRRKMARAIINFEERRVNGKLAVYARPPTTAVATFEVAGINDHYHPQLRRSLKA